MSDPKEFDEIIHCERIGDSLLYNHYVVGELVRCKDCKYWQEQDYGVVEVSICTKGGDILEMDSNDFCSRGERMDEVDNGK